MSKLALAAIVLAAVIPAVAQQGRGSYFGTVTDTTGAAVPGAKVTLTNVATNTSVATETNNDGTYTATALQIGEYTIQVEKSGFKRAVRSGLTLQVDQRGQIDFRLDVGGVAETIEVKGEAPLVDTGSATVGKVVENRRVMELPLNGRNALALTLLTPSVKSNAGPTNSGFGDRGIQLSSISINGGPNAMNAQSLDVGRVRFHRRWRHQRCFEVGNEPAAWIGLRVFAEQQAGRAEHVFDVESALPLQPIWRRGGRAGDQGQDLFLRQLGAV
jgi:hypothetical protein